MKINPRYYVIIVIVLAVVLAALGVVLLVLPEKNKVSKTEDEITRTQAEYQRELGRQAQLQNFQKDPEQFLRQINALEGMIPENVNLADVIQQLDYAAEKGGLDFYTFTPDLPVQTSGFYVFNVETLFQGRYFNVVEFFNHIERLPRTIKPVLLELTANDDGLPYLQVRVVFRAFFTTSENVEILLSPPGS